MAAIANTYQHYHHHHQRQPASSTSASTMNTNNPAATTSSSHPFRPGVLTVCTANLNTHHHRHTQQDEDEDEDEELLDGDSSGPEHDEDEEYLERDEHDHHEGDVEDAGDEDEEMVLDAVIESGIDLASHPLRILPAGERDFTEHDIRQTQSDSDHRRFVTRRPSASGHPPYSTNAPAAGKTATVPPPIVVSYGPFHHPDVDVAIPYAQMVCYLWFWTSSNTFEPQQSALQFQPQPHFVHFLRRVITQTQLSKTVLVLALHYLWLLKRPVMPGAAGSQEASMGPINAPSQLATEKVSPGSQYTVSVIALMLANKFMDDNTYTNKSWAAICGVTLEQINAMEREFLIAINHALHVDVNRFMSWIRIMQSFFDQRQYRYDSRTRPRKVIPLPTHTYHRNHTMGAPHGHHQPTHYYQPHYATSLPGATNAPSFATPPRSPGYARARSASPEATTFQFTFVPPNRTSPHSSTTPNGLAPELADRSIETRRRPVTQHSNYYPRPQDVQRPLSTSTSEPYQPTSIDRAATGNSSHAHPHGQWSAVQSNQAHPMSQPEVIHVLGDEKPCKTRSKRSASQAFSPRSAEPPRPRPDDRERERMLVYPQPVYLPMHNHHSVLSRSHHSGNGNANSNYIQTVLPQRRTRPHIVHHYSSQQGSGHAHGHHGNVRRIHHVHEALAASRPNTAVELGLARLSLSGGPSPAMPTQSHHQSRPSYYQLAAPYDPFTAPKDGEPLELQFYQLVQGNRGILHRQPSVALHPAMEVSHGDVAYAGHHRMDSAGGSSSAPGSTVQEIHTKYPSSLSTDDEEISSSESSNGTGWAPSSHPNNHHQAQNGNSYLQLHARSQQVNGNGYTLPSFSTLLAETQQRYSSPSAHPQAPNEQGVKYAEFANAGPPASYAPEWGFQVPHTAYQVQYPPLQTAFHSPGAPHPSQPQHSRPAHNHSQTGIGMNRSDGLLRPDAAFLARTHTHPQPHSHTHVRSSPSAASNGYGARYS